MKTFLRLLGKLPIRRKLSAISYEPSEKSSQLSVVSYQHSVLGSWLPDKSGLTPKTYTLIPENKLSAVGHQLSASYSWFVKLWLMPKTYYLIPFTILVFVSCSAALAQESAVHATPAVQAEATASNTTDTEITHLKIGDKIPDELWEMYFPVVSAKSDQVQYLSLGDFKDKLIILDFWATWCGSCISAFPRTYALAEEFKEDLLLMPVGSDTEVDIRKFMTSHPSGKYLPESITGNENLRKYFPFKFIPHFVWMHEGKVLGFTDPDELKPDYIKNILNGLEVVIRQKGDVIDFNRQDPFSKNWNSIFEKDIVAKTTLSKYINGIGRSIWYTYDNDSTIFRQAFFNTPLINIYQSGISKPWNFFINEAKDKTIFENISKDEYWYKDNLYCYEFIVPAAMNQKRIKRIIINDLNAKLNLDSRLEKRYMDCYVLISIDKSINTSSSYAIYEDNKAIKKSLNEIVLTFNNHRVVKNHSSQLNPILINELIDSYTYFSPPSNLADINAFNEFMRAQGIKAVPAKREIEVFILSEL